jgi:hypothetical protein
MRNMLRAGEYREEPMYFPAGCDSTSMYSNPRSAYVLVYSCYVHCNTLQCSKTL